MNLTLSHTNWTGRRKSRKGREQVIHNSFPKGHPSDQYPLFSWMELPSFTTDSLIPRLFRGWSMHNQPFSFPVTFYVSVQELDISNWSCWSQQFDFMSAFTATHKLTTFTTFSLDQLGPAEHFWESLTRIVCHKENCNSERKHTFKTYYYLLFSVY